MLDDPAATDVQAAKNDLRQSGLRIAAGVAAITAGMLAWARLELSRAQHAHDMDRDRKQRELSEQSQRNERFARSVELLGHDQPAVRLGAVYALEALAKDGYEVQSVYDVLCAFARLNAPLQLPATVVDSEQGERSDSQLVPEDTAVGDIEPTEDRFGVELGGEAPSEPYEAALTIALRVDAEVILNLSGLVLNGRRIESLSACDLSRSQITGCRFTGRTHGVTFANASFTNCAVEGELRGCDFSRARGLESVDWNGVTLFHDCRFDERANGRTGEH